jgi:hypothetical protein
MSGLITHTNELFLSPPLDLPLKFWNNTNNGHIGARRYTRKETLPPGAAGSPGKYDRVRYHWGVDLLSTEGSPVYAAESGHVIRATKSNAGNNAIYIDHKPKGRGWMTRYKHLDKTYVTKGSSTSPTVVERGEMIGTIWNHNAGAHLHFELCRIVDNSGRMDDELNLYPVDPLPLLYRWDYIKHPDYIKIPAHEIDEIGVVRYGESRTSFFQVIVNDTEYVLPLFELYSEGETILNLLRDAYNHGKKVRLRVRNSRFFQSPNAKIIVGVRV